MDTDVLATSSLGRSGLSLLLARAGRTEEAVAHGRATLHQLDEESSILLSLNRLADTAVTLADGRLASELIPLLAPWSGRVVVDANGWWCDGPVDLSGLDPGLGLGLTEREVAVLRGRSEAAARAMRLGLDPDERPDV